MATLRAPARPVDRWPDRRHRRPRLRDRSLRYRSLAAFRGTRRSRAGAAHRRRKSRPRSRLRRGDRRQFACPAPFAGAPPRQDRPCLRPAVGAGDGSAASSCVLVDWFLRHRRAPAKALVLGIDETWCTADPTLENEKPFPFWLFSANPLAYVRGLLRYDIIEELPRRLSYLARNEPARARPDGYWDYEPNYGGIGSADRPEIRASLEKYPGDGSESAAGALSRRRRVAGSLRLLPGRPRRGPDLPATIYRVPAPSGHAAGRRRRRLQGGLPAPREHATEHARPRLAHGQAPESRSPPTIFDQTHYRRPVAEAVESDHRRRARHRPVIAGGLSCRPREFASVCEAPDRRPYEFSTKR